jgi:sugar O-acyltransferase (sialic acid O-acetyltransferase NeuD family)
MIYLYGASGHAKVIIETLELEQKRVGGLVDVNPEITTLLEYPVFQNVPSVFNFNKDCFIVSIGNNAIRKKMVNQLAVKFSSAIHPSANLSKRTLMGEGTVVMAGVTVNTVCEVGKHVILNTNCCIDHDCVIGDFVHLSPNVALAGGVSVGEGTHVGIGASVIQGVKIGKWVTIGAGAVVLKEVPDFAVVVGNPGRILKYNESNNVDV